jgi:hypothetical protein
LQSAGNTEGDLEIERREKRKASPTGKCDKTGMDLEYWDGGKVVAAEIAIGSAQSDAKGANEDIIHRDDHHLVRPNTEWKGKFGA